MVFLIFPVIFFDRPGFVTYLLSSGELSLLLSRRASRSRQTGCEVGAQSHGSHADRQAAEKIFFKVDGGATTYVYLRGPSLEVPLSR